MVEDVSPYWLYLPRNLSYVGDQVWNYFVCCSRRRKHAVKMDLTVDCAPTDAPAPPDEGLPSSPKSPDSLDDSGHFEDIFRDLKLDNSDISDLNGRSDYGSDLSSPRTSIGSDVTITDDDVIPLIMSPDEDLQEVEYFTDHPINEVTTPTQEVAELQVEAQTINAPDLIPKYEQLSTSPKSRAEECAYNIFKDQANNNDDKQLSFLDLLAPEAGFFDEKECEFSPPELRRSTSLKTNKTPPGTPRRKKVVRFADAFGLDLEHVRHVINLSSPPRIPASAVADLKHGIEKDHPTEGCKYFHALFPQPGAAGGFVQRVLAQKVCLENAMINGMAITGTVRVANVGFHKTVKIRFSVNNWCTSSDVLCSYVLNSCDGATDRFSFNICSPAELNVGQKLQFAVCFECEGSQYWDSNYSQNYTFECYARNLPALSTDHEWLHFL